MAGESSHPFPAPGELAAQPVVQAPFQAHVELLQWFLAHRNDIVERIQGLLNAQRKPLQYLQDTPLLSRLFDDCFFKLAGAAHHQLVLRHQLDEAHWASGFKPREAPGLHNDLVDAAEMMSRGFRLWQQTRWPGRNGRVRYAQTLFNVYLLRRLMLLSMRLWDDEASSAGELLSQVQGVLDQLWRSAPADPPVLVRDARWLIPLAQSPTTDELAGYFEVAERVAATLPKEDRIEIHTASVRMAGGHLRSQLRHVCTQNGVSLDDHSVISSTRKSNALDLATLIQGLVPLLEAYEEAMRGGDGERRLELADAVYQGISPDPELFLNRLDLLGPYSMIEHLFIATDRDGHVAYTPMGQRHLRLLREYSARIGRLSKPLCEDCSHFRPASGTYSPYGVLFGFSSGLLEHMTLKALQPEAVTRFSLEDVFTGGAADKLAWVNGWRQLPHIPPDVAKLFEYPQQFAEEMWQRIEHELRRRVADGEVKAAERAGRLFILPEADPKADSTALPVPELPAHFTVSSDRQVVAAHRADACDETQLLHSRLEGEFLVSYQTSGGWIAVTKDILTKIVGAQRDAKIEGLPRAAADVLRLMCPDFVVVDIGGGRADWPSPP